MMCNVSIELNNKTVNIKTMIDTGNMLKEPISGLPVIVVENTALYELIPKEILDNLDDILGGDFQKIPDNIKSTYIAKLKWIPYSSLGKQNGMLVGIKADKAIVEKDDQVIEHDNVIVGIYNKSLTKRGEYRGLIGVELLS